jgi:hypothetical protein
LRHSRLCMSDHSHRNQRSTANNEKWFRRPTYLFGAILPVVQESYHLSDPGTRRLSCQHCAVRDNDWSPRSGYGRVYLGAETKPSGLGAAGPPESGIYLQANLVMDDDDTTQDTSKASHQHRGLAARHYSQPHPKAAPTAPPLLVFTNVPENSRKPEKAHKNDCPQRGFTKGPVSRIRSYPLCCPKHLSSRSICLRLLDSRRQPCVLGDGVRRRGGPPAPMVPLVHPPEDDYHAYTAWVCSRAAIACPTQPRMDRVRLERAFFRPSHI